MILLTSTSDKLQVITGSAVTTDVHVSWIDSNAAGTTITPGRTNTAITTAATTDVVAAPASGIARNVKKFNLRNKHASQVNTITVQHTDGTTVVELFKAVLAAGEVLSYVEGIGWDIFAADGSHKAQTARLLFKQLTADVSAQNVNTVQPWFSATPAITLPANATYRFEGELNLANGTTTHTTGISFTGTATVTSILYDAECSSAAANVMVAPTHNQVDVATNTALNATSTAATTRIRIRGTIRISTTGTLIPNFTFSAAPGGTNTVKRNTSFRIWPIGDNTVETVGTWA